MLYLSPVSAVETCDPTTSELANLAIFHDNS